MEMEVPRSLPAHTGERKTVAASRAVDSFPVRNVALLNKFVKLSRFKEILPEMVIVQPGLSRDRHTQDQSAVLASAYSYLKETIGVDLDVICGA